MSRVPSLLVLLATALALWSVAACGTTHYAYAPTKITSAEVVGRPATEYAFPPPSPAGKLRVATFGLERPTDQSPPSVHVRMELVNRSAQPFVIDAREQRLELPLDDRTVTLVASTTKAAPSRLEVAPGGTAALDLFFVLPPGAQEAEEVPAFAAVLTVHAGPREVTMRTPFERLASSLPRQNAPRPGHPYDTGERPSDRPDGPPPPSPVPIPDPKPVPGPP